MQQSYYDILEVAHSASPETIAAAYRSLVSRHHPDKFAALGADLRARAEARTKEINQAYEVLRDSSRRAAYDEQLRAEQAEYEERPHTEREENKERRRAERAAYEERLREERESFEELFRAQRAAYEAERAAYEAQQALRDFEAQKDKRSYKASEIIANSLREVRSWIDAEPRDAGAFPPLVALVGLGLVVTSWSYGGVIQVSHGWLIVWAIACVVVLYVTLRRRGAGSAKRGIKVWLLALGQTIGGILVTFGVLFTYFALFHPESSWNGKIIVVGGIQFTEQQVAVCSTVAAIVAGGALAFLCWRARDGYDRLYRSMDGMRHKLAEAEKFIRGHLNRNRF